MDTRKDLGLILAIIFASSVIAGSFVFFGMQVGAQNNGGVRVEDIEQAFDNYVTKQQEKQNAARQEAAQQQQQQALTMAKNLKKVTADDHIRGVPDAPLSLIVYSDFECPLCKEFHPTSSQILKAYDGKVNLVYRHYPLNYHDPMATKEAIASECVAELGGNDKFWEFIDKVFERTTSNGNGLDDEKVLAIAQEIGIQKESFEQCITSGKYDAKIKQDMAEGNSAGVSGTPGNMLLNNKTGEVIPIGGALPFDSFKQVIDSALQAR